MVDQPIFTERNVVKVLLDYAEQSGKQTEQSRKQTDKIIQLTKQLRWLTVAIGAIAILQLSVMIIGVLR